jgi:hypothetical protein
MEVSLGEFEAGMYLVEVVSGDGQRYVERVVRVE